MDPAGPTPLHVRLLAATGAVLAAAAVALSAYAAHATGAAVQAPLYTAALFLLVHGVALAVLAPRATTRLADLALAVLLAGTLLFAGSLVARHLLGVPAGAAPFGGTLMILAWLLHAAAALRRR